MTRCTPGSSASPPLYWAMSMIPGRGFSMGSGSLSRVGSSVELPEGAASGAELGGGERHGVAAQRPDPADVLRPVSGKASQAGIVDLEAALDLDQMEPSARIVAITPDVDEERRERDSLERGTQTAATHFRRGFDDEKAAV